MQPGPSNSSESERTSEHTHDMHRLRARTEGPPPSGERPEDLHKDRRSEYHQDRDTKHRRTHIVSSSWTHSAPTKHNTIEPYPIVCTITGGCVRHEYKRDIHQIICTRAVFCISTSIKLQLKIICFLVTHHTSVSECTAVRWVYHPTAAHQFCNHFVAGTRVDRRVGTGGKGSRSP